MHGKEAYEKSLQISNTLFSGDVKNLSSEEMEQAFKDVPHFIIQTDLSLIDFLVEYKIASSKREAREFLNAGSITINGEKVTDETFKITKDIAIDHKIILIRRGKKKYYMGMY